MMRWFVVALLLLTAGCTAPVVSFPDNAVRIAPRAAVALPRPEDVGRTIEVAQRLTARHRGGDTLVIDLKTSVTPERLRLVGTDSRGDVAIALTWTTGGIYSESAAWVPEALRPPKLLADLVMLYWPEDVVRQSLIGGALHAAPGRRAIVVEGSDAIRAEFEPREPGDTSDPWSGVVRYEKIASGYTIELRPMEPR